jgi:D-alanyl-lipoteichoic acid acyltransferase DltB (MBOAT superfamily)
MPFNSIEYIAFLLLIVAISFLLKKKQKSYLFIISSCLFIGLYHFEALILLLFSICGTYFLNRKIENCKQELHRKTYYRIGILFNIIFLLSLKFIEKKSFETFKAESILLFIGISFYSLQNIAFLTDTYFKRLKFKTTFLEFSLYALFFPKIVAGPIEFPKEFIPQIQSLNDRKQLLIEGLQRILFGLVKKVVIADRLAELVHYNFDLETSSFGITNLLVAAIFTFQLYFDFSGYSDIAIGSSKMLGIDLKENFQFPLSSKSITEFWRKWHISLTSWLTNYVFYPISFRMRKWNKIGVILAITITFLISGIWHGFALTFVIYAALHAIYLIVELITQNKRERLKQKIPTSIHSIISTLITFNLVSLSLIFFRSESLNKALLILKSIFDFKHFFPPKWEKDFFAKLATGGELDSLFNFYVTSILLLVMLLLEKKIRTIIQKNNFNWLYFTVCILVIFMFGVFKGRDQFIYSQF